MKRIPILVLIIMLVITPAASAELGNQGLIINGGAKELKLKAGEKQQLWVRDGLSGLPLTHGVTFYSDNDLIATVGEDSGIVQGNFSGVAHITVMSSSGRSARIRVIVGRGDKASPLFLCLLLAGAAGLILLCRRAGRKAQKQIFRK